MTQFFIFHLSLRVYLPKKQNMNRTILFDGAILKALALIIMIKRNYFSNLIYRSIISVKIVEFFKLKNPQNFIGNIIVIFLKKSCYIVQV